MAAALAISGVILALLAAGQALGTAKMARAHRDVGGFARSLAFSGGLIVLGLSLVVTPGLWSGAYDTVVGHWLGR
ncbi:MAG: hypothetical protein ACYDH6_15625 [Acidimicrobiales bacterium]